MKNYFKRFLDKGFEKFKEKDDNALEEYNTNTKGLEGLVARDDLNDEKGYKEYLDVLWWALSNKEFTNIAITGPYGSGKTSLLKTFKKTHPEPEFKYLDISLASFSIEDDVDENISSVKRKNISNKLNRLIERSILQQIFYKEKPQDIPESRFKRVFSISKKNTLFYSILSIIWGISIFQIFSQDFISDNEFWHWFVFGKDLIPTLLVSIIFFSGLIWCVYKLIAIIGNLTFSKLNITKVGVELSKHVDGSILNDHLDEILYFFEKQKYNIVLIEDIDRYKNTDIFTKLREINILLNKSNQVSHRVVFVYAIRDDLFKDGDERLNNRTKFFDFIIPVIPVINSSNSGEKLADRLASEIDEGEISRDFVIDISRFIDDMRILLNVHNEFLLYKMRLDNDSLIQEKLLSMIVFKNVFPEEFSKLQLNKGLIPKIFNEGKTNGIKILVEKEELKKESIKNEIDEIESENLDSVKELRKLYLLEIFTYASKQNQGLRNIRVGNRDVDFMSVLENEHFEKLMEEENINGISSNGGRYRTNISFSQLEQMVNSKLTYQHREELIIKKGNKRVEILRKKLNQIEENIEIVEKNSLQDLFEELHRDEIFRNIESEVVESDLLIFLLSNGFIDETYKSYVSYFYEGTLSKSDNDFILSVKYRKPLSFDYELTNLNEIINQLTKWEFLQKEILNLGLVKYLLINSSVYTEQLKNLFKTLSNQSESSIKFINKFLKEEQDTSGKFIARLCQSWHGIWTYIETESNFDGDTKDKYLSLILNNCKVKDIVEIDTESEGMLREYIQSKTHFSNIISLSDKLDRAKEISLALSIQFKNLEMSGELGEFDFFKFLCEKKLYELNEQMILEMLSIRPIEKFSPSDFDEAPYTTASKSGNGEVINYIEENIQDFVENTLLKKDHFSENEEYFSILLNNENIDESTKRSLIVKQRRQVRDIKNISVEKLWAVLIQESKLIPCWSNILTYYERTEEVDQYLEDYFNTNEEAQRLLKTKADSFGNILPRFARDFISNDQIELSKKLQFLTTQMSLFKKEEIGEMLDYLPYKYKRLNIPQKRPAFDNTTINLNLINALKENGFIGKVKIEEDSIRPSVRFYVPGRNN